MTTTIINGTQYNAVSLSDHTVSGEALVDFVNKKIHRIELQEIPGQTISIEYLEKLVNNLKATLR